MTAGFAQSLRDHIGRVLLGKDTAVDLALTTLLAGGHLLLEDKPGVGKTLLARSIARSLGLPFQRVQCTADLLPADILGAPIYHPVSGDVVFRPGPVFTSVLVADELNRTPPRTQSALLQCMAERRVNIDRETHELPEPFFVIATQNPETFRGTYPLPESQLDRFLLRVRMGYPDPAREAEIVAQEDGHRLVESLEPVPDAANRLAAAKAQVQQVRVEPSLVQHMVDLAQRTRAHSEIKLGISTRGAQALHRVCRARAVLHDRDYVVPEDIRALTIPTFAHRMTVVGGSGSTEALLGEVMQMVPVPE